jgi:predicted Zn-ribbon and HTH transcriptional regulator
MKNNFLYQITIPIAVAVLLWVISYITESGWVFLAVWLPAGYGAYKYSKWASRCPKCEVWDSREETSRDILSVNSSTRNYTKESIVNGDKIITNHEETTNSTKYLVYYKCKECGHQWTKNESDSNTTNRRV